MTENLFSFDEKTSEGKSTNINVRSLEDFIHKGKVTKIEIPDDERWVHVEFTNEIGQTANKNFFFPKDNGDAEKYAKSVKFFMQNMANIGRRYMGTEYKVSGTSCVDVARKVLKDVATRLNSKEVFCLMELNKSKTDDKIYTNIGSFSPLSDTGKDLFITEKQKQLLAEKLAFKPITPDSDVTPGNTPDDNPF